MTVCDVLVQVMAELTGESEKDIAEFLEELKSREPNEALYREVSPEEAATLRAALREGSEGPIADLVRETVSAFRSKKRDSQGRP